MLIFGCLYSKAPSCHWSKVQGWSHHCWDQALIWRSANIIYKFLSQNTMNNARIMSLSQWNSHAMFPERTPHILTRLKTFRVCLWRPFFPIKFCSVVPEIPEFRILRVKSKQAIVLGQFQLFFFKLEGSGTACNEAICGIIHKCGSLYVSKKRKKFDLWFLVNISVKEARFAKL